MFEKGLLMATGTVKWFNYQQGVGFIAPDGGGSDAFVHSNAMERIRRDPEPRYGGHCLPFLAVHRMATMLHLPAVFVSDRSHQVVLGEAAERQAAAEAGDRGAPDNG